MNNEQRIAFLLRQALEESSEHLPYRVTQRLERSRLAALDRLPQAAVATQLLAVRGEMTALTTDERPSVWARFLSTALPILIVAAGLYGIALWTDAEEAAETADIDAELVLGADDEVPVSALADKGFGVFIRNTRQ